MGRPVDEVGDAATTKKRKAGADAALLEISRSGDLNPFDQIRDGLTIVEAMTVEEAALVAMATRTLALAEKCYNAGDFPAAVIKTWIAAGRVSRGRIASAGAEVMARAAKHAAKTLRESRRETPASVKAAAKVAYNRAFNSWPAFRRWEASAQADYLRDKYPTDVASIKHETLIHYVREFGKKVK